MQEVEVETDFDVELLKLPGYIFELENNTVKKRVGCYIRENLKYRRRNDLESLNSHVIIMDFENAQKNYKRIIYPLRSKFHSKAFTLLWALVEPFQQ